MLKKILSSLVVVGMLLTIVGCSSNDEQDKSSESTTNNEQTNNDSQAENDSSILIAYFSKTGSTEEVANQIQELTGGTLAKIETTTAYPDSYQETVDIAREELDNQTRPAINQVDVSEYDTIFIGYPIWWHDAPMAIYTFIENNDFSNKTVIPFCTSGGSTIDEGLDNIKAALTGATVLTGLTANNSDDIEPWLEEIGVK